MLFALYVVEWGEALERSGEGVQLGNVKVPALFFADDVVLVATTAEGLKKLMSISEAQTAAMKLLLSETKSMVMSDSDLTWELHDQEGDVMGKKICLIGNSEPPDENMNVTSDESSGDDNKKASFCAMWKEV